MEVKIENGVAIITLPLKKSDEPSTSGKTFSYGFGAQKVEVDGDIVTIQVNAHTPVNPKKAK